jgi:hypothetical protein
MNGSYQCNSFVYILKRCVVIVKQILFHEVSVTENVVYKFVLYLDRCTALTNTTYNAVLIGKFRLIAHQYKNFVCMLSGLRKWRKNHNSLYCLTESNKKLNRLV